MFEDGIECVNDYSVAHNCKWGKYYCRSCSNLPDLSDIQGGNRSLEYALLIAVGSSRQMKENNVKMPNWAKQASDIIGNGVKIFNPPEGDHCHYVADDGDVTFNAEPYHTDMEGMKSLIDFCERKGLTFSIDGESSHMPGKCFRIKIYPK